ncbi:hypothetical protein AXE80_13220 [Wenyingzhuangia fucanilytica]|uniref:Uncharacterized protein n=1 Tax=Wenyingzhuangia fucanilytica TaxID=1790137 RepID=A0A1B1Y8Z4_9FLAO|nr:hypothetical protein [Wenyingzhuangia fucanilytica]ANW97189.1 hypothetical protein AXE80_13220 [Wenyingzhuangia fucanilytica]
MNFNILQTNKTAYPLIFIVILCIPMLFFDSVYFSANYFNGKHITSFLVISITLYLIWAVPLRLKILMLIMIPLSWLGEYIFSDLLDMYHYREHSIPLYVPFGHAIVFGTGWLLTQRSMAIKQPKKFKKILTGFYIISFCFVIFILKDTLSLFLGVLFFLSLKRKKFLPFYLMMSLIVLYLELVGTFLGAWKWDAEQGIFKTVNPPLGAIFFYVGGDMLLGKVTRFSLRQRRKIRNKLNLKTA